MLNLPDVILTYIYSFLSKSDVCTCSVNVRLTKHVHAYMPKLNRRLLAQLQVRTSPYSGSHLGKIIIHGDYMYVASQPIIQVRSLHDMKVYHKFRTSHAIYEIASTESHIYYIDKDLFGRSCHVYQTQFFMPHIEESRVLISEMIIEHLFAYAGYIRDLPRACLQISRYEIHSIHITDLR